MKLGIDVLTLDPRLQKKLVGRRVALLAHPASVNGRVEHSLDTLLNKTSLRVTAAFGPQHGMKGDKQYNMIETEDEIDPVLKIPVFSLYGKVRRPTPEMMETFDVLLYDLQDVGTRIYTYVASLFYLMEDCAKSQKALWVLDRPNPAGRPVEGTILEAGWESYVGAVPIAMRHGLTMGELALWIKDHYKLDLELEIVKMEGYKPNEAPGYGWPEAELAWVNPSPNIPFLSTARCYPGTVLIEGTNLSDGRGTTRPLEYFGIPEMDTDKVLKEMLRIRPDVLAGCAFRPCHFQPTFYKFNGELCSGFQVHTDFAGYDHEAFKPYRLILTFLKALRNVQPDKLVWREPGYEYDFERYPLDLLNGGSRLREWIDNPKTKAADLEAILAPDEKAWLEQRRPYLLY